MTSHSFSPNFFVYYCWFSIFGTTGMPSLFFFLTKKSEENQLRNFLLPFGWFLKVRTTHQCPCTYYSAVIQNVRKQFLEFIVVCHYFYVRYCDIGEKKPKGEKTTQRKLNYSRKRCTCAEEVRVPIVPMVYCHKFVYYLLVEDNKRYLYSSPFFPRDSANAQNAFIWKR